MVPIYEPHESTRVCLHKDLEELASDLLHYCRVGGRSRMIGPIVKDNSNGIGMMIYFSLSVADRCKARESGMLGYVAKSREGLRILNRTLHVDEVNDLLTQNGYSSIEEVRESFA